MGDPFNIVSLCAGGAGLDRGIHLAVEGSRTVAYVEREGFACEVLVSQMEAGWLAPAPIHTDIRKFDGRPWRGVVHCVAAGYPCQGESLAGSRRGADDDRWLWPDVARIIREIQPEWCFLENVAGHVSMGLREVATDLDAMGFRIAAGLFRASEVGAPHSRERIFILGHMADPNGHALRVEPERGELRSPERRDTEPREPGASSRVANARGHGVRGRVAVAPVRGSVVAHAAKLRRGKGRTEQPGLVGQPPFELDRSAEPVGDADGQGLAIGRDQRGERVEEPTWIGGASGYVLGGQGSEGPSTAPYPPGPDDAAAWDAYLRIYPWVTPAVPRAQRVLRRGADGMAADVDGPGLSEALRAAIAADPYGRNRMDRLRLLGNGVNPDQAALALRTLAQDIQTVEQQEGRTRR